MRVESVYRTQHPQALSIHQQNVEARQAAHLRLTDFERDTGRKVVAIDCPDGLVPIGVRRQPGEAVPHGWRFDPVLEVLLPDTCTEVGEGWERRLSPLGWARASLPGMPWVLPGQRGAGENVRALTPTIREQDGWLWALFDQPAHLRIDYLRLYGLDTDLWGYVPPSRWPEDLRPCAPVRLRDSSKTPVLHGSGS